MRLKIILVTAILSVITFTSKAQSPGYMGKKFIVKVELLTTPTFYKLNDINGYETYENVTSINGFGFSFTPSVGIEYVIGKGASAGIALRTSSLKMPMNYYELGSGYDEELEEYYTLGFVGETKLKTKMTSIYLKFYPHKKRGSIAPLGRFHQFELIVGGTTYQNGEVIITNQTDPNAQLVGAGDYQNYILYDDINELSFEEKIPIQMLKYAYGYETIIKDKIPIEMSMQIAFSVAKSFAELTGNVVSYKSYGEFLFYENLNDRFSRSLNITFNIGLGYLVF